MVAPHSATLSVVGEEDSAKAFLAEHAPDIAALVGGDIETFAEALAIWEKRNRKEAKELADAKAEDERQHRVATELLCTNLVAIAQLRGLDTARKYQPDMALPGRAVTMQTLLDAQTSIEQIITIWKEEGLE